LIGKLNGFIYYWILNKIQGRFYRIKNSKLFLILTITLDIATSYERKGVE